MPDLRIEEDWSEIDNQIEENRRFDLVKQMILFVFVSGVVYWFTAQACIWIMKLMIYRPHIEVF